ncbi:MAG: response regulator [Thermodesulfobacteriota bacterium]
MIRKLRGDRLLKHAVLSPAVLSRAGGAHCGIGRKLVKTILLADDEANLRTLVRTTLDDPAYRILEAADGASALALARQERPDLLVLDWMMPGMSGVEVATALRQDPATAHIPIILLTARGQEKDKEQGQALGLYAYLVKPFSPLELLEKVQEVLGETSPEREG